MLYAGRGDVMDVAMTAAQGVDFRWVYIETDGSEAAFGEGERQWQAHVPEPDDADGGVLVLKLLEELIFERHVKLRPPSCVR